VSNCILSSFLASVFVLSSIAVFAEENTSAEDNNRSHSVTFIKKYCIDCHTADDPSGEREFESLDLSGSLFNDQLLLQEMIDQLTLGTMPPEDGDQPSTKVRLAAIESLTRELTRMRQETTSTGGRTVLRRLSRREYRRTIGDLLGIDMTMFDPTIEFPGDNLVAHFDNVGDALVTSGHLLEHYLNAADQCVEKALSVDSAPKVREWKFQDNFRQQPELSTGHKAAFNYKFICLYDHPYNDKPEGAYGYVSDFKSGVPVDGVYEVRLFAKAMHRDTPYSAKSVRIDLEEPFRLGIRPGDTSIGDMYHQQPIQPKLAEAVIADDEFRWYTFQVPLDKGFAPRFTFENGIHDVRGSFTRVHRHDLEHLPKSVRSEKGIFRQRIAIIEHGRMPHIRIDKVEIRGPIEFAWPTRSQQILMGKSKFVPDNVEQLIDQFASRAFRRPATTEEAQGLLDFYQTRLADGQTPQHAYKDALKATLCSPAFLYFKQHTTSESETLSEHALAERLSYFLTSTMPDQRLRELADTGQLSDRETLRAEVQRLLNSQASDAFVADFLESWLDLRSLGSMPPDPNEFWFYYAAGLKDEMKTETRMFLRDLIDRDASVVEMLSSNHSFINRDLAKLYGVVDKVPSDSAENFRKVIFDDARRGGLLGQASIMTVSANGIETSPVVRGVWLLENILGTPTPPPPDDVPAIDPDTRGATTIRDQIIKHRDNAACFQCHRKIDPLGFALEGFDPIGRSREYYDNKRKMRIDTSGVLPGGDMFSGLPELKQKLISRKRFFVRTFTERLLMHALGRRIEPIDRESVDAILDQVQGDNYPTAQLIEAIVMSDLFQR